MKKLIAFLSLFGSFGTLICCAIPATLVAIGSGAALASAVSTFPQLIWLSQQKLWIFGISGLLLALSPIFNATAARNAACPTDPNLREACETTRTWTRWVYPIAVTLYLFGAATTLLGYWL